MVRARRAFAGSLLIVASFSFVGRAAAQAPPAADTARGGAPVTPIAQPSAPPEGVGAPQLPIAEPHDDVLRRLLRSGCRDGIAEARALAAGGGAPWAATVVRLCGEISEENLARSVRVMRGERSGRGTMVFWSTLYGLWTGIALDVLFEVNEVRGAIVLPLAGMGAGLALSLGITANHPLTNGQAWTIATGLEFGSFNGALWAGGFNLDSQAVVGTTLATGLAAGATSLLVAREQSPTQGDVEVVRSGLLWGTVAGLLATALIAPDVSGESLLRASAVSMDLGFLGGLALASSYDVSRNRDLIIDASALGGTIAGGGIAILAMGDNGSGRIVAGGALAGMAVGLVTSILLTRDMDDEDDERERSAPVAALFGRDERGRWRVGSPTPTPVLDGLGRRVIGATLTALGGTF
jgi:hypothetical protein